MMDGPIDKMLTPKQRKKELKKAIVKKRWINNAKKAKSRVNEAGNYTKPSLRKRLFQK